MPAAPLLLLVVLSQGPVPPFESVQSDLLGAGGTLVNAWADIENDADLDLFVGFNGAPNRLYRNDGGTLVDVAPALGLADARPTRAAAWGDLDADGDPDLVVGFTPGAGGVLRLYRNFAGRFVNVSDRLAAVPESAAVRQLAWVDFDGDDDLDLFAGFRDRPNALFRNDRGSFTDVAAAAGIADPRRTVGAVWFDYDEDGDLDLYVANMDGDANGLYRNDAGRFTDVAGTAGAAWAGRKPRDPSNGTVRPCAADVNNDGRLDLFAANYGTNGLLLNRGGGRFEDVSAQWGVAVDGRYDACAFSDFDNDGRLDLYVNGTVTGGTSYPDYLFRNTGTRFDDVTPANIRSLQADHGVQWADYDLDGDEDLALTGSRADGMHRLLRNQLPPSLSKNAIEVRVIDGASRATRAGAEVRVYKKGTRELLGTRLVDAGSGYNAQSDMPVHIGTGQTRAVDLEITFPRAGTRVTSRLAVDTAGWPRRTIVVKVPGP